MSGRIYDHRPGIPICDKCGNYGYRTEETNFNGNYCPHCKNSGIFENYDEEHPLWKDWINNLESNYGKLILIPRFEEFSKLSKYKIKKNDKSNSRK